MRLVVDLQGVQAEIRSGVRTSALEFVSALLRVRGDWEVVLACSGWFPDTIGPIRAALGNIAHPAYRTWHAPALGDRTANGKSWRDPLAARIREALFATLDPDVVCVLPAPAGCERDVVLGTRPEFDASVPILKPAHPLSNTDEAARMFLARCRQARVARASAAAVASASRPRLAYVSPLPPERSGIADYSAEILPALARHYDIEVVVAQDSVADSWVMEHCPIRSADWLRAHAHDFDRVLYHFGNSEFHRHMFTLLRDVPGTVVLHDFFLGHVQAFREMHETPPQSWVRALYRSHGYGAVVERFASAEHAMWKYPANLEVLQRARGVIVHSAHVEKVGRQWYGDDAARNWAVVPLPRAARDSPGRDGARRALGVAAGRFVVCSFGVVGPSKLNHRLLDAWLASAPSRDRDLLVFVGADPGDEYASRLVEAARDAGAASDVIVTGWVDAPTFRTWLAAADVAVQLRGSSRGETSAAVLDCMAHGLPTIVNANGALAELDAEAVVMLPDAFDDAALAAAIDRLRSRPEERHRLGARARAVITREHDVDRCAARYFDAIERLARLPLPALLADLAQTVPRDDTRAFVAVADAVASTFPALPRQRQIFVDASITCQEDLRTGIQRVVRALAVALLSVEVAGRRVEPVYAVQCDGGWQYRYARAWTANLLGLPTGTGNDDPIEAGPGDLFLAVDLATPLVPEMERANVFRDLANKGVELAFVVYDLLPLRMPEMFPPGRSDFHDWFHAAARVADRLVCISQAVASEVRDQLPVNVTRPPEVSWFHLGGDMENSAPTRGHSVEASSIVERVAGRRSFLMVGTIEPRKGHLLVLEAFERLWARGIDVDLVIVGAEGWRSVPESMRRTVPHIVERLTTHTEFGKHLFWLGDASDELLDRIYQASTCLIAASEGEGFGLPLVEGARHGLPIIARDIPVFREVAGEHAHFFSGESADALAGDIEAWIGLFESARHPRSEQMRRQTWRESAQQLLAAVGVVVT